MLLEKQEPLVLQPTPEKVFPHEWIANFTVQAPTTATGYASFNLLPYNAETKEIGDPKYAENLTVYDLFACVSAVPEAAQAYGAILNAIGPIRTWLATQPPTNYL